MAGGDAEEESDTAIIGTGGPFTSILGGEGCGRRVGDDGGAAGAAEPFVTAIAGIGRACGGGGGCWWRSPPGVRQTGWPILPRPDRDSSDLSSVASSWGFQFFSKLTIGRPGLSLTADGVGSLGLRSFSFMLVACLISSLRISMPCFRGTSSRRANVAVREFVVYCGFLDWLGGFR